MTPKQKRLQRDAVERYSRAASRFERVISTLNSWGELARENNCFNYRHRAFISEAGSIKGAMMEIRAMIENAEHGARGLLPEGKRLSEIPFLTSAIIALMDGAVEAMVDFEQRATLEMKILREFSDVPKKERATYPVADYSAVPLPSVRGTMLQIGLRGFVQNFIGDLIGLKR